jgi:hypothetical protein
LLAKASRQNKRASSTGNPIAYIHKERDEDLVADDAMFLFSYLQE